MNVCAFSGRLTRDPELRATGSGKSVTSFTIAVNRPGVKDKTDFIDCVAWEGRAEFITRYFTKGMKIEVSGCMTTRDYENREGQKRKATELLVATADFAEKKQESSNDDSYIPPAPYAADADGFVPLDVNDDDLPF